MLFHGEITKKSIVFPPQEQFTISKILKGLLIGGFAPHIIPTEEKTGVQFPSQGLCTPVFFNHNECYLRMTMI